MSGNIHDNLQECIGAALQVNQSSQSRVQRKQVSWTTFHELNGYCEPVIGGKYLIARSAGTVEPWVLMHIDESSRTLMFMCC